MEASSRVTIRDVAAHAGVSVATVSKVIKARYGVSAATYARVQAAIQELGYEAGVVAAGRRGTPHGPTSAFAANDTSAIATLKVADEPRLRVPQDVPVVKIP